MSETKDWRKICADCQEGEPPKDCEYFGESGGCNAPTMGKHPTCKESLQVGNAAKMHEALEAVVKVGYPHNFQREAPHIRGYCYEITTAIEKCFAALSAPPRNCDRQYQNGYDVLRQFTAETGCQIFNTVDVVNWLLAEVKGGAE